MVWGSLGARAFCSCTSLDIPLTTLSLCRTSLPWHRDDLQHSTEPSSKVLHQGASWHARRFLHPAQPTQRVCYSTVCWGWQRSVQLAAGRHRGGSKGRGGRVGTVRGVRQGLCWPVVQAPGVFLLSASLYVRWAGSRSLRRTWHLARAASLSTTASSSSPTASARARALQTTGVR